nr:NlpC/P60 family protein [Hyphomonas sp. Mor2]
MLVYDDPRLTLSDGGSRVRMQVSAGVASLRKAPEPDATQVSQILFGETVRLHHESGAFGLVQCEADGYVGWVLMEALSAPVLTPTHRVISPRLHAYAEPKVTAAPNFVLGRGAVLTATGGTSKAYLEFERAGWIASHLVAPIDQLESDPASVAEAFIGTPYLWGGRDCLGLDCSGLIQIAYGACGVACPRDSDMQAAWFGEPIADWNTPGNLRRGDLVFWDGHVGIMLDAETLLHSNGTFMTTMKEPLRPAIERIAKEYGEPIGARRIDMSKAVGAAPAWMTIPA